MVFEQAWNIVKDVDFRIPKPTGKPPSYTDEDANLAFRGSKIPNWWNWDNPHGQNPAINPVTGKEWEEHVIDPDTGEKWPTADDFWDAIAWEIAFKAGKEGGKAPTELSVGDDVMWTDSNQFGPTGKRGGAFVVAPPYMDYKVGDFGEALEDFDDANFKPFGDRIIRDSKDTVFDELERASIVRAVMDAGLVSRREIETALDETSYADARGWRSRGQVQVSGPPLFPEQTYRRGPEGITEYAQDQNERFRLQQEHEAKYPEPQRRGWLTTQLGGRGL